VKKKIVLGSAQFGLDYGINNKKGKVLSSEVFKILNYANANGVSFIDTAYGYGDSEKVLGSILSSKKLFFDVVSKLPSCLADDVYKYFNISLQNLQINSIYGYLIHDFNSFLKNLGIWHKLVELKNKKKIGKIGFSLYYPRELEYLLEKNYCFDIVQIPFNIFDQRFLPYLSLLKSKDVEVHVRSVFLQGLVFKNIKELEGIFFKHRRKLSKLREYANDLNVSVSSICLNFVLLHHFVDRVVIGVDSLNNLKENFGALRVIEQIKKNYGGLVLLKEDDENFILPINW